MKRSCIGLLTVGLLCLLLAGCFGGDAPSPSAGPSLAAPAQTADKDLPVAPAPPAVIPDTTTVIADTTVIAGLTGNPSDTTAIADTTVIAGPTDSTVIAGLTGNPSDTTAVITDSTVIAGPPPTKKELREKAYLEKLAAREARWAKADSIDAAKAAEKLRKKEERKKAREERVAEKQRLQDEADARKLEKYVARYRKKYERQQARLARKNKSKQNNTDGKDPGPLPEVRQGGHPEQRELGKPTLHGEAAEPAETPVSGVE